MVTVRGPALRRLKTAVSDTGEGEGTEQDRTGLWSLMVSRTVHLSLDEISVHTPDMCTHMLAAETHTGHIYIRLFTAS